MAKAQIDLGVGGGGSGTPDYFENVFTNTSSYTHTFTDNLEYVFIYALKNSTGGHGTYNGTGTLTNIQGDTDSYIDKIENVKAGDTYNASIVTISQNRVAFGMVGKLA